MQILAVDIGTGTQDIFLLQAGLTLENGLKLVMPSATMIVRGRIQEATRRQRPLLLTGVTMGGGPSTWAAEAHRRAGLPVYATPDAARTFNDDLEIVQREMGVEVVSEDEAQRLAEFERITLQDFDFAAIATAFGLFGVDLRPAAVAVAVFDHGAAPPGVSDRQFRFDYLADRIRAENRLTAFAYRAQEVPAPLTRLRAVVSTARDLPCPLVVMDTAPAAILGATLDPRLAAHPRLLAANIGNFHALAFRLGPAGIEAVFEHHTGLLDPPHLESLLSSQADGTLTHAAVFGTQGHGALIFDREPLPLEGGDFGVAVTGPRRGMLQGSPLRPYFAAPHGDMMLAGCFGLLMASAELLPDFAGPIHLALSGAGQDLAPWDLR
jgi:uncharacterized protein (DUF1786 family)